MRKASPPQPPSAEKRPQPGRLRAIFLAVLVHAAFFALIVFGVTWQSRPTEPLQAELWDKLPPAKSKAPPAKSEPTPEPPKPEPPKPEPPKPEPPKPEPPKPEPPKPQPPPKAEPPKAEVKPEPPKPDPAIAEKLEREKRAKVEREKQEQAKRERLEREKQELAKKEQEKAKKEREEKAKREKEELAKKKREQEELAKKKREEEELARQDAEKRRVEEQARAEAAKARQSEIDRYISGIKTRIRSRANIPDNVTGHPEALFRMRLLPGGELLDVELVKSSGNRAYDAAIERAIRSAQRFDIPPPNSELFPQFRELNLNLRHER